MAELLLSRGTVIDGTGAAPRLDTSVLVSGDRIVSVGAEADVAAAASHATAGPLYYGAADAQASIVD